MPSGSGDWKVNRGPVTPVELRTLLARCEEVLGDFVNPDDSPDAHRFFAVYDGEWSPQRVHELWRNIVRALEAPDA